MNENDEVTAFLAAFEEAERTGDTAAHENLLTDDFVAVGPLGFLLTKSDWKDRHGEGGGLSYDSFELTERELRRYGDTTVGIAMQKSPGNYHGNPIPSASRATFVLVRDGGRVTMAGIQMSFVAGTPGAPPIPGRPS